MTGGVGNDTYVVERLTDVVNELAGEGPDTVQSKISYTLLDNFEILTLTGVVNISGTGNAANNTINGNSGNNTLDGGLGADMMFGGNGNDTYVIDNALDRATEVSASGGIDTVRSSVTFAIAANVEHLVLTGADAINGTGNSLDNQVTGNAANNVITGGLGADLLNGNGGNDSYRYTAPAESTAAARDTISQFNAGDKIDLSVIDANGAAAGNAFTFVGANAFSGVAGELRATQLNGVWTIEGDTNGDSIADLVIAVTSTYGLTSADFVL